MKTLNTICTALGAGLIGFFANKLDDGMGIALFTFGVILLTYSIVVTFKKPR
ncbi:MAG: hypothetical protein IKU84_02395 [Clostridia bacterium]|nr:hypothetical protein [Clostridia bacterium]